MSKTILITGGAGFIGSHLTDELLAHGHRVRVLDNLSPQVHIQTDGPPSYLSSEADFVRGDICDPRAVRDALEGVDSVVHLAAAVGVAQSMYEIEKYVSTNSVGTSVLLEALMERQVERLVVASSMSIYGEGLYRDPDDELLGGCQRGLEQLRRGDWEVVDESGRELDPVPTPESKQPALNSVYALSKYDQERLCLMAGTAYGIPTVALRFFNVFGTRQSLSNPYTGVLAIFISRYFNGRPPLIFEDGRQQRDFVAVEDVAQACRLALEVEQAAGNVYNVGSGRPLTVLELAQRVKKVLDSSVEPEIVGKYRMGDIRHCFADISRARAELDYEPGRSIDEGLVELASWIEGQAAVDRVDAANAELGQRGLTV